MAGNVWELTDSYYYANCDPDYHIIRGESWYGGNFDCPVSYRGIHNSDLMGIMLESMGFRVCR